MKANKPILRVKNLKMWFPIKTGLLSVGYVRAVDGVSISVSRGETLAVVGESGSGKTTLGKTILRLYEPVEGTIYFNGRDITHLRESELRWFRRRAQIIYQDPFESLNPFYKVSQTLEEPLMSYGIKSRQERLKMVYSVLEMVKLTPPEEFAGKYPHMLSGGQRQRVAIARAIILNPNLLVSDEPVSMLDASVRAEILYLLKEFQEKYNIAQIYITHDLSTTKYFTDRMAVMYAGKIVELGRTREVLVSPLHPYTEALIEAIPDPDPENRLKLRNIPSGEPPSLVDPPSGCRFHPRCPHATEECKAREPELTEVKPGHYAACHRWQTSSSS